MVCEESERGGRPPEGNYVLKFYYKITKMVVILIAIHLLSNSDYFYYKIVKVMVIWIAIPSLDNPDYLMRDNLNYQNNLNY